jgi:hypothetical protein
MVSRPLIRSAKIVDQAAETGSSERMHGAAVEFRALGWGRMAACRILREHYPAKMAQCGPFLYYLMKGLESLQPFACNGTACLWHRVSRRAAPHSHPRVSRFTPSRIRQSITVT